MGWDWKDIVKSIAPTIGTALGGPFGGMATKFLTGKLLVDENAGEDELAQAIAGATPEQLAQIKQIDAEFQTTMRKLEIDLEQIHAGDRDSARRRQVESGDRTPQILAYIYTVGLFAVLIVLSVWGDDIPDKVTGMLQTAMGVLFAMVYASKDYFFGSSAGSKRKTELMGGGSGTR